MAGHWIKWEKGLTRKPEVMQIATALGVTDQHAAACLMLVWEWADDVTVDGLIRARADAVDRVAGHPGLSDAMIDAGWLVVGETTLQFPNYDRHNGSCAKARALDASRKRSERHAAGKRTRT